MNTEPIERSALPPDGDESDRPETIGYFKVERKRKYKQIKLRMTAEKVTLMLPIGMPEDLEVLAHDMAMKAYIEAIKQGIPDGAVLFGGYNLFKPPYWLSIKHEGKHFLAIGDVVKKTEEQESTLVSPATPGNDLIVQPTPQQTMAVNAA